jgi:hypothetical protein
MKKLAVPGFLGILLVAAVTVAVWASAADAPWEESSTTVETMPPTPPSPAYTEKDVLSLAGRLLTIRAAGKPWTCFDADYRPLNQKWVVNCMASGQVDAPTVTLTFDDQTGKLVLD